MTEKSSAKYNKEKPNDFKKKLIEIVSKLKSGVPIASPDILQNLIESGQCLHNVLPQGDPSGYAEVSEKLRSEYAKALCKGIQTDGGITATASLADFQKLEVSQLTLDKAWVSICHHITDKIKKGELLGSEMIIKDILSAGKILQISLEKQSLSDQGRNRIETALTNYFVCGLAEVEFKRALSNVETHIALKNLILKTGSSVYPEIDIGSEADRIEEIFHDWEKDCDAIKEKLNSNDNSLSPDVATHSHLLADGVIAEKISEKLRLFQIQDIDHVIKHLLHDVLHNKISPKSS